MHEWSLESEVEGVTLTNEHKHEMIRKVASSSDISDEDKLLGLENLKKVDKTDKIALTEKYCEAASPFYKEKVWDKLFSQALDK